MAFHTNDCSLAGPVLIAMATGLWRETRNRICKTFISTKFDKEMKLKQLKLKSKRDGKESKRFPSVSKLML